MAAPPLPRSVVRPGMMAYTTSSCQAPYRHADAWARFGCGRQAALGSENTLSCPRHTAWCPPRRRVIRWAECSARRRGPARRREVGEMRFGTRPAGAANRRGGGAGGGARARRSSDGGSRRRGRCPPPDRRAAIAPTTSQGRPPVYGIHIVNALVPPRLALGQRFLIRSSRRRGRWGSGRGYNPPASHPRGGTRCDLGDYLAGSGPSWPGSCAHFQSGPADARAIIVTGAGEGGGSHLRVFDAATGAVLFEFLVYDPAFTGGVRVAAADVNGDGVPDVITAPGPGGGPHVRVFDGAALQAGQVVELFGLFAYNPAFTGGGYIAAAAGACPPSMGCIDKGIQILTGNLSSVPTGPTQTAHRWAVGGVRTSPRRTRGGGDRGPLAVGRRRAQRVLSGASARSCGGVTPGNDGACPLTGAKNLHRPRAGSLRAGGGRPGTRARAARARASGGTWWRGRPRLATVAMRRHAKSSGNCGRLESNSLVLAQELQPGRW